MWKNDATEPGTRDPLLPIRCFKSSRFQKDPLLVFIPGINGA